MHNEANCRVDRRHLGLLAAEIARFDVENDITEPRTKRGNIANPLRRVLTATLVGIFAGCRSFSDMERLTANLSGAVRKLLNLPGRLSDTSASDVIVRLDVGELRNVLRKRIRIALRAKQLRADFPLGVVSCDGKVTSTFMHDPEGAKCPVAQVNSATGNALVRTVTSCLVSTAARPCIDMHPVPPENNEMSTFTEALDALLAAYGRLLFEVVMYDSGATSLANANDVRERNLDYVFSLTDNQPTLAAEAARLLGSKPLDTAHAKTTDLVGSTVVERYVWLTDKMTGYLDWKHLRTVVRICCVWTDKTTGNQMVQSRYYVSSLHHGRLTAPQWLDMIRRRWSVENQNHNTFDTALFEDDSPWLRRPQGMLVMHLLRRLVYNALAIYRSVTTRSETKRATAWSELLQRTYDALLRASRATVEGMRKRTVVCG